jgi:hypothetical protein
MDLNNIGSLFDKIKKIILEKDAIFSVIINVVKKETGLVVERKNIKINKKTATILCAPKEKTFIYIKKAEIIKSINSEAKADLIVEIN